MLVFKIPYKDSLKPDVDSSKSSSLFCEMSQRGHFSEKIMAGAVILSFSMKVEANNMLGFEKKKEVPLLWRNSRQYYVSGKFA